jgi:hypothetical protein
MTKVLTIRIAPELLAKAESRAVQLGLDRAGYVRSLIAQDLETSSDKSRRRFASEDLVGAFRLGGKSATNRLVRQTLKRHAHPPGETDR